VVTHPHNYESKTLVL